MNRKISIVLVLALTFVVFSSQAADKKAAEVRKEVAVKVVKKAASVQITAEGRGGYHCNTLYPWKLTVKGPQDEKKTYKKADAKKFSEQRVVFEVPSKKGQTAQMKLSVCNEVQCIMHTEELSW